MSKLDEIFGIKLYMICELGVKHHEPHVHAQYNEYGASYDLNGHKISKEGYLPYKQENRVQEWIKQYKSQLIKIWGQLVNGDAPDKLVKEEK